MTIQRLIALMFIFGCTCVGWFLLGTSVVVRTRESDKTLAREVEQLWGGRHVQIAPSVTGVRPAPGGGYATFPMPIASSRVEVDLKLDQRRKGLLWYDTYVVAFHATYVVRNTDELDQTLTVHLSFPSKDALYDGFSFRVAGQEVPFSGDVGQGIVGRAPIAGGGETTVEVSYRSRGLDDWAYAFGPSGVAQVKDFLLEMTTDVDGVDFPAGTMSPARQACSAQGCRLTWEFASLLTGARVGVDLPERLNPGPLASRITFFAPVSLLFFMTVMVILGLLEGRSLHPMNYFFLSAAFFSFHLLLAYLADHIDINAAFIVSAATSVGLVVSYLRAVCGMRFAVVRAGLAQLLFLVLFSYAFFFEGYAGLTVTIGSIVTLSVLMQITARLDWAETFARPARSAVR